MRDLDYMIFSYISNLYEGLSRHVPGRYFCCGSLVLHFVVVVALLFYVHGKHLRSCRDGQLT